MHCLRKNTKQSKDSRMSSLCSNCIISVWFIWKFKNKSMSLLLFLKNYVYFDLFFGSMNVKYVIYRTPLVSYTKDNKNTRFDCSTTIVQSVKWLFFRHFCFYDSAYIVFYSYRFIASTQTYSVIWSHFRTRYKLFFVCDSFLV